jgi:predicted  nucleic acid-binding Zn-ribbon protein
MHSLVKTRASLASRIAARWLQAEEQTAAPSQPPDPSSLQEDEYQVWKDVDGIYYLIHKSNGKLWMTQSEDSDSFNPNDAEELADDDADWALAEWDFVKSGSLSGGKLASSSSQLHVCSECGNGPLTTDENGLAECPDCGWEERARSVASKVAARWLQAQQDITTQVKEKLDRDGDDKEYDKAIVDFVEKTRGKLPPIDKALEKAAEVLLKTREKIEHRHPKVQDRYVQLFLQELAQKHRELEDMRKQLMRGLTVELDRYEAEANVVE